MGLFGRKKRKINEFGMEIISVEEALRATPVRIDQTSRYNNRCNAWDNISYYDVYKSIIEKYRVGDIFVNKVGAKIRLAKITEYELVFNWYSDDSYFTTYHKWDYYGALKCGLGFDKI